MNVRKHIGCSVIGLESLKLLK